MKVLASSAAINVLISAAPMEKVASPAAITVFASAAELNI